MRVWSSRKIDNFVEIPVHMYNLDCGVTVPQLDEWFTPPFSIRSVDMSSYANTRMKVYYQLASGNMARVGPVTTELVVFPRYGLLLKPFTGSQYDMDDVKSVVTR